MTIAQFIVEPEVLKAQYHDESTSSAFSKLEGYLSALESLGLITDSLTEAKKYGEAEQAVVMSCVLANPLLNGFKKDTLELSMEGIWDVIQNVFKSIWAGILVVVDIFYTSVESNLRQMTKHLATIEATHKDTVSKSPTLILPTLLFSTFESVYITHNLSRINLKTFLAEVINDPLSSKAAGQIPLYRDIATWCLNYVDGDRKATRPIYVMPRDKLITAIKSAIEEMTSDRDNIKGYNVKALATDDKMIEKYRKITPEFTEEQIRKAMMIRINEIYSFLNDYLKVSIMLFKDINYVVGEQIRTYTK